MVYFKFGPEMAFQIAIRYDYAGEKIKIYRVSHWDIRNNLFYSKLENGPPPDGSLALNGSFNWPWLSVDFSRIDWKEHIILRKEQEFTN